MKLYIEDAKSNKSKCKNCNKIIEKGSKRLVLDYIERNYKLMMNKNIFKVKKFFCKDCSNKFLNELINQVNK